MRSVIAFLISIIIARELGPIQFGLFSLFIVLMIIASNLMGEGMDAGVVKYYAKTARKNQRTANEILASAFALRLVIGIPIVLFALFFGEWLAMAIYHDESYITPIRLGLIGAFFAALWSFVLTTIQSTENFKTYSYFTPIVNILRLIAIPLLFAFSYFKLSSILIVHIIIYIACTLYGFWYLRAHFKGVKPRFQHISDQFHFGKWTILASLFFIVTSYMGIPILTYFSDPSAVGIFSAAIQLLMIVDQMTIAILTVQLPAVSKLTNNKSYRAYIRRYVPIFSLIAISMLPGFYFIDDVIILLYGDAYAQSASIFKILLIGFLITLVTHPIQLILLSANKPHMYALIQGMSLVTWLVATILLIPTFGAAGAAWALLISRLTQAAAIIVFVWFVVKPTASDQAD